MDINHQLLDSIAASIYWKDLSGVYLGCNKYMLMMTGLESKDQIIGKTDYALPWRKQANKIKEIDKLVVENNKTYELEENPLVHDGTTKNFLSSKTPLLGDNNEVVGVIGVSIDITEKKKLEDLLRHTQESLEKSMNIKERFLKNISHETRNPLQAFVGSAEILEEKWDVFSDEQRYKAVKLIASSSRRIATLVNNTFDLSHLISGKETLELKKASLTELINKSIQSINNSSFDHKKPKILMSSSKEYSLVFDEKKIQQVIDNLLMNAIKWTNAEKTVTVEIYDAFLPDSSVPAIQCCIKDQGIKIPDEELDFIFEPFTESSNTASKACGVGLGLALSKEIIKLHMGAIWVENNIKEGVVFNFVIPTFLTPAT
jgi:PAS domain S-box-containing protein